MRTVRFRDPAGNVRRGEWTGRPGDDITLRSHYSGRIALGTDTFRPDEVDVLAPCDPSKIVCTVGDHPESVVEQRDPDRPEFVLKPPSSVAAHGETITLPAGTDRIEYGAQLGVVIAEQCKNVPATGVESVVSGFTCVNDLSNPDEQAREQNWVRARAFDGAAPIGPVISRPENVPENAAITLSVNEEPKQTTTREELVFSVGDLVEAISRHLTLQPGDVLTTGLPATTGPLRDGDSVTIEIDGVGVLRHHVATA